MGNISRCRPQSRDPGGRDAGWYAARLVRAPRADPAGWSVRVGTFDAAAGYLDNERAAHGVAADASTWEHFPHDADIGVAGVGPTKAAAFEQAALALTAVVTDPAGVRCTESVPIECRAATDELLLVEWLNALVYEMAVRRMVFGAYGVTIDGRTLHATACGERVDVIRHEPAVEVKGATLTALRVGRDPGGWRAQCVVDV